MKSLQFISAIAVTLVAVTGCSAYLAIEPITLASSQSRVPDVEVAELEPAIADKLEAKVGLRPDSVECEGPLKGEVGATQRCVLSSGSVRYGLTVTTDNVVDQRVHFAVEVDPEKMP